MKKAASKFLQVLLLLIFFGSCAWAYNERGYEPLITAGGSLVALLASLIGDSNNDGSKVIMSQKSGRKSTNQQSARDIINKY